MEELANFKFDIYERINLVRSEHAIKRITLTKLETDLAATIDGDNVLILGSLVLTVDYFSVLPVPHFTFSHLVPVEIRIPANRFVNIACIKPNIVTFHVEQMGSYVLNLTGVLSISEVELELARSAPETTASPSETAADKGILTEEELNSYEAYVPTAVIQSHRNLLSANAELSFKNQKLKDAKKTYEKALGLIADATYEGPVGALKWRDIANDALEAFDNE